MEYMFDTANIEAIEEGIKIFPITGVTSNPSIIKKEGKIDFFNHFRKIREIIGSDKTLHIQVVAQGLLAIEAGADFIAPYFNRMENMSIDPRLVIKTFADIIEKYNYPTKILAASFKNIGQVNDSFAFGAQTATMAPEILLDALKMPAIQKAVDDFTTDWKTIYGDVSIVDLV
ncbi:transaldolase [Clostridium gelidum]|uniref:Transaldolase n=1 Tax=Clostridium gelidum TaxID=704125 RepID=A0ABM7TBS0_9CLOT|nr:transaldolase family protein [Clostridium gelidum]BCZ49368.1 transaldolase [Clostridium gelidum]